MPIEASELAPLPWSTWWRGPRVAQVLRELLGVSIRQVALGLPRAAHALPSAHAVFSMGSAHGSDWVDVLVPHGAVRVLADRVLGGSFTLSEGTATGAPLPAELGAVAYLCARLAAAAEAGWVLGDARLDAAVREAEHHGMFRWPVAVHTELGALALHVVAPAHTAASAQFSAELVLGDDEPIRAPLVPGDLVMAPGAELCLLGSGLCGALTLRVAGFADEVTARVGDGQLRALHVHAWRPRTTELVLATPRLDAAALVALRGTGFPWAPRGDAPALLRSDGRVVAEGELVWLRGALGLRVTRNVG